MFFFKKPVCAICGSPEAKNCLTKDAIGGDSREKNFCRVHFFEEFKKEILQFPHKMIVTFPLLSIKHAVYGYYPTLEMRKFLYEKADEEAAQRMLHHIPNGKVGFFDKAASEKAIIAGSGQYCSRLNAADMQILSKEEVWAQIQTGLSLYGKDFKEGFRVPYGEEGVFLTSLL
jgi:hypothetical protein